MPEIAVPDVTPEEQAFLDLVKKLGPVLNEVAKAAVTESIAAVPVPTFRPGVVQGVSASDRTASVLIDGDTAAITAQVLVELPYAGARVMVEFVPPSAVFVAGYVTQCGVPAGVLAPYGGSITTPTGSPSTTGANGEPPPGWLWCFGQAVSRSTYSALFAAIGSVYGAGDGATTFNVPDLRGRDIRGLDNMGGSAAGRISGTTLGAGGGTNAIAQGNLPNVNFSVSGGSVSGGTVSGTTSYDGDHTHGTTAEVSLGLGVQAGSSYTGAVSWGGTATSTAGAHTHTYSGSLSGASYSGGSANSGGSGNEFLPPYMLVHIIIKA